MTIANNFVTDKNSGEVMTVGWVQSLYKSCQTPNVVKKKNILNTCNLLLLLVLFFQEAALVESMLVSTFYIFALFYDGFLLLHQVFKCINAV